MKKLAMLLIFAKLSLSREKRFPVNLSSPARGM